MAENNQHPAANEDGPTGPKVAKKRVFHSKNGDSKPVQRNEPGSFLSIVENRLTVAVSLADLSIVMNTYATHLSQTLPANERAPARWGIIISTAYNLLIFVEKQHQATSGMITIFNDKPPVSLPDVLASAVEAMSPIEHDVEKISILVDRDQFLEELGQLTLLVANNHDIGYDFGADDVEVAANSQPLVFPWTDYLLNASRYSTKIQKSFLGNGGWRVPTPKAELSLLGSGVVVNGNMRRVVSNRALSARLEYLTAALGMIEYRELGETSYVPIPTVDSDLASLASRVALRTGRSFTRDTAMRHILALGL